MFGQNDFVEDKFKAAKRKAQQKVNGKDIILDVEKANLV